MTDPTVRLTIDGQSVQSAAGSTIYEAATAAGIHIPTFCHHPKLTPVGACRTCMVEIEGVRGLQTACTTPVREGMVVKVHTSPAAVKQRQAILEFLLTNHPLDCPVCDKGGECPLQNQAMADGPGQSRYVEEKRHKHKRHPLSELIVIDQERCVLCWRCIRFLDEWADDHELDLFGRGAGTRLQTVPGRPLRSKWQGNTIDVCPVGALTSRVFRFEARVWELTNQASICPMCAVGCNIFLGVKNNQIRRIVPRQNDQVNDAWICDKGRFTHGFVGHPDRLTAPLIRRDGRLEPATWDEALQLCARRLGEIVRSSEHGPQAVAGLGSTRVTNEANYLFQRFLRTVVGSNSVDHLGRMPHGTTPLSSLPQLEGKDLFVLLGLDPSTEAPLVELWIKKAVLRHKAPGLPARAGRVIVAHPRRIELSRYGLWLGYRPGSEVALLNGLARAVLDAGAAAGAPWTAEGGPRTAEGGQPAGQPRRARPGEASARPAPDRLGGARVANLRDFGAWLQEYTPPQVEHLTGTPAQALREAARLLAGAQRPIVLYGADWARPAGVGSTVAAALQAVANLTLLLGGIEAGFVAQDNNTFGALDMGVTPDLLPGRQLSDDKTRSRLAGIWGGKLSPRAGLDFEGMVSAANESTLQGLWVMGADPAAESRAAGQALGRVPFLVVQDLFMTETASLAEVVLPAASFAETDGSFANLTGRLQAVHAALRPPGEARPDWWILAETAKRMVDGRQQKAWEFAAAADVTAEMSKVVPAYRGLSLAALGGQGRQPDAEVAPSQRLFIRADSDSQGPPDAQYPLILSVGRLLYDRGTVLARSGRVQKLVPAPLVLVHPADAAKLDLAEGDEVTVVSETGQVACAVTISDEIVPGVVHIPHNVTAAPLSVLLPPSGDGARPVRVQIRK